MFNKILIIIWYLSNQKYYRHFFNILKRKFLKNHDTPIKCKMATDWAKSNTLPYVDALIKLGLVEK